MKYEAGYDSDDFEDLILDFDPEQTNERFQSTRKRFGDRHSNRRDRGNIPNSRTPKTRLRNEIYRPKRLLRRRDNVEITRALRDVLADKDIEGVSVPPGLGVTTLTAHRAKILFSSFYASGPSLTESVARFNETVVRCNDQFNKIRPNVPAAELGPIEVFGLNTKLPMRPRHEMALSAPYGLNCKIVGSSRDGLVGEYTTLVKELKPVAKPVPNSLLGYTLHLTVGSIESLALAQEINSEIYELNEAAQFAGRAVMIGASELKSVTLT